MKRIAFLALTMAAFCSFAGPAYRFTLQIDGCTDSMILLGGYYAKDRLVYDTAYNDGKGRFVFEGDEELLPGLYFFDNLKDRSADFVVYGEKPRFRFHTAQADWTRNMTVSGSKQNTLFYNFQRSLDAAYDEIDRHRSEMDSVAFNEYRRSRYPYIDSLRMKFIAEHPESMLARMMLATKDPGRCPDSITGNDRYFYIMHHYFDNMPLGEDFLVRTPRNVFYERLHEYVDKNMHGLGPEHVIPLIDTLIDRSEPSPEVFKYLVHTLTEYYLQSPVMVYDEVYVHLVKRYYGGGKAFWADPSWIDREMERALRWEPLLVGRVAPELILADTLRRAHSLHHMPGRYTLLVFWSPVCGHCRDIIPAIYKTFDRLADSLDLTAFAILSEPDSTTTVKWKRFIADHHIDNPRWVNLHGGEANVDWHEVYDITSTPQIYLIENKEHRIVAKRLNADLFETICRSLLTQ